MPAFLAILLVMGLFSPEAYKHMYKFSKSLSLGKCYNEKFDYQTK